LQFENRTGENLRIARIEASCSCVKFENAIAVFEPRQSANITLVVDLRDDTEFRGNLGVPATGFDENGREIFTLVICIRVPP
jgi:hypothetical protein